MSNPTKDQFEQLRRSFDGNDGFMRGCSVGGNPHSGNRIRAMNPPEWAVNNDLLRQVLLRSFPRMWTNETQLRRALLWMEIIYLFFRRGLPAKAVAMRLFNNDYAEEKRPWLASANPEKYIEDTVRRIRRTATGLRSTGKPRSNTKGRPKKAAPVKSATK